MDNISKNHRGKNLRFYFKRKPKLKTNSLEMLMKLFAFKTYAPGKDFEEKP